MAGAIGRVRRLVLVVQEQDRLAGQAVLQGDPAGIADLGVDRPADGPVRGQSLVRQSAAGGGYLFMQLNTGN